MIRNTKICKRNTRLQLKDVTD